MAAPWAGFPHVNCNRHGPTNSEPAPHGISFSQQDWDSGWPWREKQYTTPAECGPVPYSWSAAGVGRGYIDEILFRKVAVPLINSITMGIGEFLQFAQSLGLHGWIVGLVDDIVAPLVFLQQLRAI